MAPAKDEARRGFLRRATAATAFGEGLDGYDLGTISVVLARGVARYSAVG
jgi:MFS transporter, putative metabolite transport protein